MLRRVDSRDVLDVNGRTRCAFAARLVARYQRVGPNIWDDYQLLPAKEEPLRVAAGVEIQVEDGGTRFRLRRRGQVVVAEWTPSDSERGGIAAAGRSLRDGFLEACVVDHSSPPPVGLAALIAKKLRDQD